MFCITARSYDSGKEEVVVVKNGFKDRGVAVEALRECSRDRHKIYMIELAEDN